jgi:hypothetical protein
MPATRSGFVAWGNVKDLALIQRNGRRTVLVANNNDAVQAYELRGTTKPTSTAAK